MGGVASKLIALMKKFIYLTLQCFFVNLQCVIKFFKIQMQKCKRATARRKMAEAFSSLGAEVYSLHKQNESDWERMPLVQQQIKAVEEAESQVIKVDETIEDIKRNYQRKKEEIRERYAEKRRQVDRDMKEQSSSFSD